MANTARGNSFTTKIGKKTKTKQKRQKTKKSAYILLCLKEIYGVPP